MPEPPKQLKKAQRAAGGLASQAGAGRDEAEAPQCALLFAVPAMLAEALTISCCPQRPGEGRGGSVRLEPQGRPGCHQGSCCTPQVRPAVLLACPL